MRAIAGDWLGPIRARLPDGVVYWGKWPYRWLRRATNGWRRRLDFRSDVPLGLQISLMRGALEWRYRGVKTVRYPIDLPLYMQLIWELQPKTIVEIGSKAGGSALLWSDLLRVYGLHRSRVVSVDLEVPKLPCAQPGNVTFLKGDEARLDAIKIWPMLLHPWLVINDASHQPWLMLPGMEELDRWMVGGDWLVVEDGWLTSAGMDGARKGGPAAAIEEFLVRCPTWQVQRRYCDFYGKNVTANPNGWLRKL